MNFKFSSELKTKVTGLAAKKGVPSKQVQVRELEEIGLLQKNARSQ
jgi:hypothetical protein